MSGIFDSIAGEYDRWYDAPRGSALFRAERDCILSLYAGPFVNWLEVGVGTGRFASALGVPLGLDPSPAMLSIAASRGIAVTRGRAENLPFADGSLAGVLMALTLSFVDDASRALAECCRVLRPDGHLLMGIVPADSELGTAYQRKGQEGHPIYSEARFRTVAETLALAAITGFQLHDVAGTLFRDLEERNGVTIRIVKGAAPGAGFLGLLLAKRT